MLVKIDPGKRDIEFFGYICEDMGYLNNANLEAMIWLVMHFNGTP